MLGNDVIIKVNIHSSDQKSVFLTSNRQECISDIKQRLEKSTNLSKRYQILYFRCRIIDDDLSIEELIDSDAKMIEMYLDVSLNGGAQCMEQITAPNMTSENCFQVGEFALFAPRYRYVCKGVTFEGLCRNNVCEAYNRRVLVMLNMCEESNNICCYNEYMFELECPACKTPVSPDDISNVIFYSCTVKVKYKIVDNSRPVEYEMVAPTDKYLTLKNAQEMLRYNFIKFTLK